MSCIERSGRLVEDGSINTLEAETSSNGKKCGHEVAPPLELLAEVASAQLSCVQEMHKKSAQSNSSLRQIISSSNELVKHLEELEVVPLQCKEEQYLACDGKSIESRNSVMEEINEAGITTRLTEDRKIKCKRKQHDDDTLNWPNLFSELMGDLSVETTPATSSRFEIEEPQQSVLIDYEALGISPTFKIETSTLEKPTDDVMKNAILDHDYIGSDVKRGKEQFVKDEANAQAVEAAAAIFASLRVENQGKRSSIQQLQEWEARSQLTGICVTLMSYVPIPGVGSEIETKTDYLDIQQTYPSSKVQDHIVGTTSKEMEKSNQCAKAEKEKALALKYLEDTQTLTRMKTSSLSVLECQICQPRKFFTAYSSLINHYRSHAGIKLFECKDCGKAFTRHHSLKYHKLIHSGATRFTCKECGWKGRHPFHFKEHKRRHTGEYPYQCTDCLARFKTRNTYKRHLKARHNKILAPNGTIFNTLGETCETRTVPDVSQANEGINQPTSSKIPTGITLSTPILIPRTETVNLPLFQQVPTCVDLPPDQGNPVGDLKKEAKLKKKALVGPQQNPSECNPLRTGEQVDYKKMNEFMANNSMFNKMFVSNKNLMTIYTQPQNSTALTYVTVKTSTVPSNTPGAVVAPLVTPVLQVPVYMQVL